MESLIKDIRLIQIEDFPIADGSQQRGIGDIIEYKLNSNIEYICEGTEYIFNSNVGKKGTGDCEINFNKSEKLLFIDCKTHNRDSKMSMPNLI